MLPFRKISFANLLFDPALIKNRDAYQIGCDTCNYHHGRKPIVQKEIGKALAMWRHSVFRPLEPMLGKSTKVHCSFCCSALFVGWN